MVMPGRDEKGRFIKGHNQPGPGRPPRATEEEYRETFKDVVPLERFARILERQATKAEAGDIQALYALMSRLVPEKSNLSVEHSGALNILGLEEMLDKAYGDDGNRNGNQQPADNTG